jgi:hypothetical protein
MMKEVIYDKFEGMLILHIIKYYILYIIGIVPDSGDLDDGIISEVLHKIK